MRPWIQHPIEWLTESGWDVWLDESPGGWVGVAAKPYQRPITVTERTRDETARYLASTVKGLGRYRRETAEFYRAV